MDKYNDDQWLDNLGRQYEIAMEALIGVQCAIAEDLARRTGANIDRVHHALDLADGPLDGTGKPWLEEVVAVNQQLRSLMGEDYGRVRARLQLMDGVVNDIAQELTDHRGGNFLDLLCSYATDHKDGYSEGFAAWLRKFDAESERTCSRIDEAARLYDVDEVARLLFIEPERAVDMLGAYVWGRLKGETFAHWAWRYLEATDAAAE